ncbi:MAG: cyanophycin synthetase, partial [Gammaproteobacteria bacterium]
ALERLSKCKNIPGRIEYFGGGNNPQIIVDYAHTSDALAQILQTLKSQCHGKLYCVFGCGGDRDQGKRSQMGAVAQQYADVVVLTNDNPRYEDPDSIIQDIKEGIQNHSNINIETDRETAIVKTIAESTKSDIVLIAGKGHELYQEINGVHHPFSDQDIVCRALESNE